MSDASASDQPEYLKALRWAVDRAEPHGPGGHGIEDHVRHQDAKAALEALSTIESELARIRPVYEAAVAMDDARKESHGEWVRATEAVHAEVDRARAPR